MNTPKLGEFKAWEFTGEETEQFNNGERLNPKFDFRPYQKKMEEQIDGDNQIRNIGFTRDFRDGYRVSID